MSRATKSTAPATLAAFALLAVLGLAGCSPSPEKEKPAAAAAIRTEVRSLFERYVEALNKSDSTGVVAAYAQDAEVTLCGMGRIYRGRDAISETAESLLNPGQNTYGIDSLDVVPIEKAHALALVVYTIDPSDQDIPAFRTTATYVLEKSSGKWQIIHAHVSPTAEE
ncbi:MAG TPA: SgcJ/EcaC family oxidoreductase [Candidatus Limnocylindrales bacterium]|nr:SgcJ/EcaC family oxidoreductase [Candidatus Limnocylindrales bacterium]